MQGNDRMVWFHTPRDGQRYYVEIVSRSDADLVWDGVLGAAIGLAPALGPDILPTG